MKFLKLLDPWATQENTGLSVDVQQELAATKFPELVRQSYLHYWRPGDHVIKSGTRLLIGISASFDLKDLRLADIVNDEMSRNTSIRVDIFDLSRDIASFDELSIYFPIESFGYVVTPIAGLWKGGEFEMVETGFDARRLILETIGSSVTPEEAVDGLRPPDPSLMED